MVCRRRPLPRFCTYASISPTPSCARLTWSPRGPSSVRNSRACVVRFDRVADASPRRFCIHASYPWTRSRWNASVAVVGAATTGQCPCTSRKNPLMAVLWRRRHSTALLGSRPYRLRQLRSSHRRKSSNSAGATASMAIHFSQGNHETAEQPTGSAAESARHTARISADPKILPIAVP